MHATRNNIRQVLDFYKAMGVERIPLHMPNTTYENTVEKGEALERLRREIGDCTRCKLHTGRKHIVFGDGNASAELMFVGEGPGQEEDLKGLPFVGAAGGLLDRLIERMGYRRDEVYIANIVKCRPPGNRDPEEDEVAVCLPFLKEQIRIIAPRAIITLGRIAAHTLTGHQTPISRMRGKFLEYDGIDLMPTFHPSYLLRTGSVKDKELVKDDAVKVLARLGRKWIEK